MDRGSDFGVYQGSRHVQSALPIIIVTADTKIISAPTTQHFFLTDHRRLNRDPDQKYWSVDKSTGLSFDDFKAMFTIPALLDAEFQFAKDGFETAVLTIDRSLQDVL